MPIGRLARKLLALTIAYAIVLGGVAGPALGHGFDPAAELCAPSGRGAAAEKLPGSPEKPSHPDCCPALCGSLAAILPPISSPWLVRSHGLKIAPAPVLAETVRQSHVSQFARAPPAV